MVSLNIHSLMNYSYAPDNKRVWRGNNGNGTDEVTFWSISGRKLGTCNITQSGSTLYCTQSGVNLYFGGKLIKNASGWVYPDRLGSVGKYYPYGIERPSATGNNTEKFTGYYRDAETGNDYAVNRYESPGAGRFLTPDSLASPKASDQGVGISTPTLVAIPTNRKDSGGSDSCTVGVGDYEEVVQCEQFEVYNGPSNPQCMLLAQAGRAGNPAASVLYETYCTAGAQQSTNFTQVGYVPSAPLTGDQEEAIFATGLSIADYLLSKTSCASLFGQGTNPITVLNTLASGTQLDPSPYGFFQWTILSDNLDYATTTDFPGGYDVVLLNAAANGPNAVDWNNEAPAQQGFSMAITLIHELGHVVYNLMGGASATQILPDGGLNNPQEGINNSLLIQNCWPPGAGNPPSLE